MKNLVEVRVRLEATIVLLVRSASCIHYLEKEKGSKMFQLSAERVAALMKTDLKSMLARTKKEGRVAPSRVEQASKVKEHHT